MSGLTIDLRWNRDCIKLHAFIFNIHSLICARYYILQTDIHQVHKNYGICMHETLCCDCKLCKLEEREVTAMSGESTSFLSLPTLVTWRTAWKLGLCYEHLCEPDAFIPLFYSIMNEKINTKLFPGSLEVCNITLQKRI